MSELPLPAPRPTDRPAPPASDAATPRIPDRAGELRSRRFAALVVFVAAAALLSVAWSLEPAQRGFGTHESLGLPACTWPARFGLPCPSCGMTTAFAYAAKGRIVESFVTQPMGCLLALAAGMSLVGSAWTLVSGHSLWPVYERFWNARAAWLLGLAALLAWGYKIVAMNGWLG